MKPAPNKRNRLGFTLVELLVVIVIIAILSTIGFSVGLGALHKARRVTAQAAAMNVANAVEHFYSEYNLLPDPADGATEDNGASPYVTDSGNGVTLLDILAGFEDVQNGRKLRFLGVKESDNGKRGGIVYNGTGDKVVGLFDPWGQPYYIVLDYDYDGRLELNISLDGSTYAPKLNNKNVAVYSLGTETPSDAKRKDLIKTW
jgi:prepilin-type N-terminal cleavage/methylation domain-containing protein